MSKSEKKTKKRGTRSETPGNLNGRDYLRSTYGQDALCRHQSHGANIKAWLMNKNKGKKEKIVPFLSYLYCDSVLTVMFCMKGKTKGGYADPLPVDERESKKKEGQTKVTAVIL